jgi:hypothetical protein
MSQGHVHWTAFFKTIGVAPQLERERNKDAKTRNALLDGFVRVGSSS